MRQIMRSILCSLIGLSLLTTPAIANQSSKSSLPRGSKVLEDVLRAEERVRFEGEQVLSVWTGKVRTDTVAREFHLGPGLSRVEYLSPKEVQGRLVVNDGSSRWEYDPAERIVIKSSILRRPVDLSGIRRTLSRVLKSYTILASSPTGRIAGREVIELIFTPKRRDRESKHWWVDSKTSVVLRRDVLDSNGLLRQSSRYTKVSFRKPPDPALAKFVLPAGTKVVNRAEARVASTLASAKRLLPTWANIPPSIGAGFWFDNARVTRTSGVQTVQVQYSDGVVALSLFLSPGARQSEAGTGSIRHVNLGPVQATLVQPFPPYRVLYWYNGGKTYSLVADISEQTLIAIARKLL